MEKNDDLVKKITVKKEVVSNLNYPGINPKMERIVAANDSYFDCIESLTCPTQGGGGTCNETCYETCGHNTCVTCANTCPDTCYNTCNTCPATCANTCPATCANTCPATCGNTCGNNVTCMPTCYDQYSCYQACTVTCPPCGGGGYDTYFDPGCHSFDDCYTKGIVFTCNETICQNNNLCP